MQTFLRHLELESLIEIFQSEGVDLPMLLAFNETEMKECMKDIGIKRFGDRFKIVKQISVMKKGEHNEPIIEEDIIDDNEIVDQIVEDSEEFDTERLLAESLDEITDCELCKNSTQHVCRRCGELVCILYCSVPDPDSENEMHVVHKDSK